MKDWLLNRFSGAVISEAYAIVNANIHRMLQHLIHTSGTEMQFKYKINKKVKDVPKAGLRRQQ